MKKTPQSGDADSADAGVSESTGKNERLDSIINKMVKSRDPVSIAETYREWATDYDADLQSYGYVAPRIGSQLLHSQLPAMSSLILDAGCGTGLVGESLVKLGYTRLHGTDFSPAMLEKATARGLYESLFESDFTASVGSGDGVYDAVISMGVYKDIFKNVLISEMLRVCKPGGLLVFSARPEVAELAESELQVLRRQDDSLAFTSELHGYMTGQNAYALYFTVTKGV